ncbi:MAG: nucleotidyl transferase AbiEii/AbiGii toxin family protein [Myxococcota bacterium]
MKRRSPLDVLPPRVTAAVKDQTYWFVIGGQAVRCFAPYRPSRDVDFGVIRARDSKQLVAHLRKHGVVDIIERDRDTVHLMFEGIDVSIFVLKRLGAHVHDRSLDVTGVLATKTHALLDRGLRRDFFDLYVMMQIGSLGLLDCVAALREVYESDVNEGLVLRALTYFDDADDEPRLPGEGPDDWSVVTSFFSAAAAALLVPPQRRLEIQARVVDIVGRGEKTRFE